MSKLSVTNSFGLRSSLKSTKTKDSLTSKKSRLSGSFISVHGSKFGRTVSKSPKQNDPGLVQTLSTVNSRVIRTVYNPYVALDSELPDLSQIQATDCIRELGNSLNILDYEFNYASFWILDTVSKLIKDLQLSNCSLSTQHVALAWFRFVLRSISVTGASREDIFSLLQEMFKIASKIIHEGKPIPQPEEINVQDIDSVPSHLSAKLNSLLSSKSFSGSSKSRRRSSSQRSLNKMSRGSRTTMRSASRTLSQTSTDSNPDDKVTLNLDLFCRIIEMIYQVFADRFMFTMVSLAYSSPTMVTPLDIHLDFHDPKQPRPPAPEPPPPGKNVSPKSSPKGDKKSKEKGKKKKSSVAIDEKETEAKSDSKKGKKAKGNKKLSGEIQSNKTDEVTENIEKDTPSKKSKNESSKGKKKGKSDTNKDVKEPGEASNTEEKTKESGKGRKSSKSTKEKKDTDVKDISEQPTKEGKGAKQKKSLKKDKKERSSSLNEAMLEKGEPNKVKKETDRIKSDSLDAKAKMFDRLPSPEMELEQEKIRTKDQFLLPLSEAVGKSYVENLLKTIIPQENKPVEEPTMLKETEKERRQSRHSSVKEGKKKQKDKKKK